MKCLLLSFLVDNVFSKYGVVLFELELLFYPLLVAVIKADMLRFRALEPY